MTWRKDHPTQAGDGPLADPKRTPGLQTLLLFLCTGLLVLLVVLACWVAGLRQTVAELHHERYALYNQMSLRPVGLPVRFVIEEPECSSKLIRSLGIRNVHVSRLLPSTPYVGPGVPLPPRAPLSSVRPVGIR